VLGLDRGGCCPGIAYRVPARLAEGELRLLWRREMLLGSYAPRWVHASQGDKSFRALAFVVNRHRSGYAGRLPPERIVDILRKGHGKFGNGIEYLRQTVDGLAAAGIRDPRLHELDAIARATSGVEPLARRTPQASAADTRVRSRRAR
jgi:cation transport protein ChaC